MNFFKIRNSYIVFIVLAFLFKSQAYEYEESTGSFGWPCITGILSNILMPCFRIPTPNSYTRIINDEPQMINESFTPECFGILNLPLDVLYIIGLNLPPSDLVSLIKSNPHFRGLREEKFWTLYNRVNHFSSWNESIQPMKIAFSHFWFMNGEVRKAADFGFPDAVVLLKKQEALKNAALNSSSNFNYHRSDIYLIYTHRKSGYNMETPPF